MKPEHYLSAVVLAVIASCAGCSDDESPASLPTVTTSSMFNITFTSATGGGNVTDDGGAAVTDRGLCFGTSENPTINDFKTKEGEGTGTFTLNLDILAPGTVYYVRAYATNSAGTGYGTQVSFSTEIPVDFDDFTLDVITALEDDLSNANIPASSAAGVLVSGKIILYKTSEGRFGKMEVVNVDIPSNYKVTLNAVTYNLTGGGIYKSNATLEVRGTFLCDLDELAEETAQSEIVDFQWDRDTSTDTYLEPFNSAKFSLQP